MVNITAIYCLKDKKDRNNIEKYCQIVEFLNRQTAQGDRLCIQGLYEAKKAFRCENLDPYGRAFRIARGEYFLLVDGKDYDTNTWRLQRACRSEEEAHLARPLIGIPDDEDVYAGNDDDEFDLDVLLNGLLDDMEKDSDSESDGSDENDYIRLLDVQLPSIPEKLHENEDLSANYIAVYQIHEATKFEREDTWGIFAYTAKDFADPELSELFKNLAACHSKEDIENIENYPLIANAIIKLYEKDHGNREIEPHNSIVIGVIDGKTNYWNCGLWYYKAFDGETSLNPVQDFAPEGGYKITADGYIPIFTAIL